MKIHALFEIELPDSLHGEDSEGELKAFEEGTQGVRLVRWGPADTV